MAHHVGFDRLVFELVLVLREQQGSVVDQDGHDRHDQENCWPQAQQFVHRVELLVHVLLPEGEARV